MSPKRRATFLLLAGISLLLWNLNSPQECTERVQELSTKGYYAVLPSQPDVAPCGQVCTYTGHIVNDTDQPYPQVHKDINCKNIMKRMAYRHHIVEEPPPRYPPKTLIDNFTMNGQMPITKIKYFDAGPVTGVRSFTKSHIQGLVAKVREGIKVNQYKAGTCVEDTLRRYENEIAGTRSVVMGTLQPWLEAILLAYGASNVTTLEYSKLELDDGRLRVFSPHDFADLYLAAEVDLFDFGASFTVVDHCGLGRYKDPLNPYGDLEAMAQVWCMMKDGGVFMLGLPCTEDGRSFILWNANRMYGAERLQHVTANWELLEVVNCTDAHKLFMLRKPMRQQQLLHIAPIL